MTKEKMIKVLDEIIKDTENDAREFDGKPFNGKTVAEYFGNQGAEIQAVARIVKDILKVVKTLRDQGKTVLIVEQNAKAVLEIADRGYVMETGSFVLEGSSEELLDNNEVRRAYLGKDYKNFTDMGGTE